jgi:hypothetical protein
MEKQQGVDLLNQSIELVRKNITAKGGTLSVKEEVSAYFVEYIVFLGSRH